MNDTHFPKEDHLPDWARQDNKVTKGDRVEVFGYFLVNAWLLLEEYTKHEMLM